jgi:hypothetical protein
VTVRYWWVNQNQTYRFEVPGGFLWSPKTRADGARNYFYDTMTEVQPGDLVFSYSGSLIRAVGVAQRTAYSAPKPDFESAGENWSNVGWYLETEFSELSSPIRPKDFIDEIRPHITAKYSPLRENGDGKQNLYLTEITKGLAELLLTLSSAPTLSILAENAPSADPNSLFDQEIEMRMVNADTELEKVQLVKARRGQGIFKANVRLIEKACRVTGVTDVKHLRASHIKPWASSSNQEKLDGHNGLLLSPHIDHLFDRGFISFKDSGELITSPRLNQSILEKWSIKPSASAGEFSLSQKQYLEYHRDVILKAG